MKAVKADEMTRLESVAYKEGVDPEKYMLNAGNNIAAGLVELISIKKLPNKIIVVAGKGNNAGDGYVAAKDLLQKGYNVCVYQLYSVQDMSQLCLKQYENFIKEKGKVVFVKDVQDIKLSKGVILDGILGTGFKGELTPFLLEIVKMVNSSDLKVVSIDIPSGLNGNTGKVSHEAIKADYTFYLGLAKIGFFINDGPNYIGNLRFVDFGLDEKYKKLAKQELNYMQDFNYKEFLPKIERKRHKYEAGLVVGLSGSLGMFGAAKLAALAAYRSGSGIVKLITEKEIPNAFYELVNLIIDYKEIDKIASFCNMADAVFIGPGLGRDKKIEKFLNHILPKIEKKTVLDADALYYLAYNLNAVLPKETAITPHRNEMKRILKADDLADEELIKKVKEFSKEKNLIVVLKGYPTIIFHPQKDVDVIIGGDPGLATAGTGDVLTGMIASFASQKLDLYKACILAVNMHFLAATIAAEEKTSYSLMASDVIEAIPKAFKRNI